MVICRGGAGGKGVWGKPGSELYVPVETDEKDPNYDSDSLDNGDVTLETIVPQLSLAELYKSVEPIILEYYGHGDTKEVFTALHRTLQLTQDREHQISEKSANYLYISLAILF